VDNWRSRNCQFTSVYEVDFGSLYLFTGMSYCSEILRVVLTLMCLKIRGKHFVQKPCFYRLWCCHLSAQSLASEVHAYLQIRKELIRGVRQTWTQVTQIKCKMATLSSAGGSINFTVAAIHVSVFAAAKFSIQNALSIVGYQTSRERGYVRAS
jgi:hypothetical protein